VPVISQEAQGILSSLKAAGAGGESPKTPSVTNAPHRRSIVTGMGDKLHKEDKLQKNAQCAIEYSVDTEFIQSEDTPTQWMLRLDVPTPLTIHSVLLVFQDSEDDGFIVYF
jgi:hypothetical protein